MFEWCSGAPGGRTWPPVVTPARVDAQDATPGQIVERLKRLEHNLEILRSAANTNAHQTNVRFSKQGGGIDIVLVDADAAGMMGPRSEPAIRIPEVPNPF